MHIRKHTNKQKFHMYSLTIQQLETETLVGASCMPSGHHSRCKISAADWKPNFLPDLTVVTNIIYIISLHWLLLRDFTV